MSLFDSSIVFYVIAILLFGMVLMYVWRKLNGIENYTKILEKKNSNLRRENNELLKLLKEYENDQVNVDDADVIMNTIFNESIDSSQPESVEVSQDISTVCTNDKCTVQEIVSEPVVHNIITEAFDAKPEEFPVSNIVTEQDNEIESVVSDNNGGIMNRKKLSKMNLDKIKDICVSMNLPTDGTKNILIDRILS